MRTMRTKDIDWNPFAIFFFFFRNQKCPWNTVLEILLKAKLGAFRIRISTPLAKSQMERYSVSFISLKKKKKLQRSGRNSSCTQLCACAIVVTAADKITENVICTEDYECSLWSVVSAWKEKKKTVDLFAW